ncbi:MAG: hypothetical protein QOI58_3547 [Thermoanaerobaculia bacterium]|jgi:hypothetical protein|nr:hypothetical protein [Thermoanaerobaculia bacterium]
MRLAVIVPLLVLTMMSDVATAAQKNAKHATVKKKTAPPSTTDQEISVKVFAPRFVQPNHSYDLRLPIKVKVNADDAAALPKVRVRVFPNKDAATVKVTYLDITQSGCHILASRVEPYFPTFDHPDIELAKIYPFEMSCDDDAKYLAATKFVLVIESDDGDENRFLQIRPGAVMNSYFQKPYSFTVVPEPHQPCVRAADHAESTGAQGNLEETTAESALVSERDAKKNSCVTTVEKQRPR